jgi:hypothetical protein
MELNQNEKNILVIGKFLEKIKKQFATTEIRLEVSKATKQNIYSPKENTFPLVIYFINWPLSHMFHWTGKEYKELGYRQMSEYISDKKGKKYSIEEMKDYIKKIAPELFNKDFYQNRIDITNSVVNEQYNTLKKKLIAINLANDLESSLDNKSNQTIKKNKI